MAWEDLTPSIGQAASSAFSPSSMPELPPPVAVAVVAAQVVVGFICWFTGEAPPG